MPKITIPPNHSLSLLCLGDARSEVKSIVKKLITKANIRTEIDQQILDFLEQGGKVNEIERGISGRENANGPQRPDNNAFQQPKAERTYVPEVIAAIDARRNQKPEKKKTGQSRPKKKIIYDDFGEPLRWEWVEE